MGLIMNGVNEYDLRLINDNATDWTTMFLIITSLKLYTILDLDYKFLTHAIKNEMFVCFNVIIEVVINSINALRPAV